MLGWLRIEMYDLGIAAVLLEKEGGFQFCAPERFRYYGAW
jgi:hypothetical protein